MSLNVNTGKIREAAKQIHNVNNDLRDGFLPVEAAVSNLSGKWKSSVSASAIQRFRNLRETYCDSRYNDINNMVQNMEKAAEKYESNEKKIVREASAVSNHVGG